MDNKKLGIILLVIAVVFASSAHIIKIREDSLIKSFIEQQNTCYLEDGTCLHEDRDTTLYIVAWIASAAIAALGFYLIFFEKSQKAIISTLEKEKHIQTEDEKFSILMKGLDADEQRVIKAVKEQDGITQQTLRLRADMHKSKLSIVLDRLEKKGLVKRVEKGKTNQVFLKVNI